MTKPSDGADRGSGTIWMLTLMVVVWLAAWVVIAAGGMRAARHRAHSAADLAALTAARRAPLGRSVACARAAAAARANGARLTRCQVTGAVADVFVAVPVTSVLPIGELSAIARSRAGPARTDVSNAELPPDDGCYFGSARRFVPYLHH